MEAGTCDDRATVGLAALALTKINEDRTDGFVLRLEALSNAHQMKHGETGMVYYLTLDVAETKCHVLSKQAWKDCEPRGMESSPVTGQCKAVIYINKVKRIDRLYKYICNLRPVSVSQIVTECPDCPTMVSQDNSEVEKTLKLTMEKFNKEGGQDKYFVPLNITKAYSQGGIIDMYAVEYIIQETVCSRSTDITEAPKCDKMTCEFAHKGHCVGSYTRTHADEEFVEVTCKIFEPEAAEEEKKRHLLGGELDHSHSPKTEVMDGHDHTHDHTRPHTDDHTHDHSHGDDHDHSKDKGHHHTHEHKEGHGHAHVHEHSHDHAHDHDHVHAHHSKAHDHSQDQGEGHHHQYAHDHDATHEHDHELALDHQHQHRHLHQHEHHHHHHDHPHHPHDHPHARRPEGSVHLLPALDGPATLPFFPDQPADADPGQASTLPFFPDSEAPGEREPTILPFPRALSPQCPSTPRPLDKPGA